jgi:hypothetical protein
VDVNVSNNAIILWVSSKRASQDEDQSNFPAKERKKENLVMGPKAMSPEM